MLPPVPVLVVFRVVLLPVTLIVTLFEALAVPAVIFPPLVVMLTLLPMVMAPLLVLAAERFTFSFPAEDVMFLLTLMLPSASSVRVASVPLLLLISALTVIFPSWLPPATELFVWMVTLVPLFSSLLMLVLLT